MSRLLMLDEMISKANSGDSFRGGDPTEIEIKKEEKELDKGVKKTQRLPKDAKKLVTAMLHRAEGGHVSKKPKVIKAQPGEEAGSFRGGDPEEIRIKREEKLQEMEDSGQLEDQDIQAETGDEPTQEEIEEAQEEEKQKQEDRGKSLTVSKAMAHIAGQQVSPVDTFGDYNPLDANGDPVSLKIQQVDEKYKEPAPVRPGKNQHRLWSEVIGTKLPLTGDPIHHLRRYHEQGRTEEMTREARLLTKAINRYDTGLLSVWREDFVGGSFYTGDVNKGIGSAPAPHHKYVKRWFEDGKWNYAYQGEEHSNHGIGAMHDISGHTVEVHPGFKQAGQPGSEAKAFEYSRRAHLAEGGEHDVKLWDHDQEQLVDRKLVGKGSKDKEGNIKHDKEGMPVVGDHYFVDPNTGKKKRAGNTVTAIESNLRPVETVKDPYGDPWMHYHVKQGRDPESLGRPRVVFDHRSRFNPDIDPTDPKSKKWSPAPKTNIDQLREWVGEQQSYMEFLKEQEGRGQMHPEERKGHAKDWEPTFGHHYDYGTGQLRVGEDGKPAKIEHKITNALERGDVGNWSWKPDHLYVRAGEGERGPLSRDQHVPHGQRAIQHGVAFHIEPEHEAEFMRQIANEHGSAFASDAEFLLKKKGLRNWNGNDLGTSEGMRNAKMELAQEAVAGIDDYVNSYNPKDPHKGRRLAEHIRRKAADNMGRAIDKHMTPESDPKRYATRRVKDLARTVARKKKLIEQDVATGEESGFAQRRKETLPQLEEELARQQAAAGMEGGDVRSTGSTVGSGASRRTSSEGGEWTARRPAGGQARQGRQEGGVGHDMGTQHLPTPEQAALRRESEEKRRQRMVETGEAVGRGELSSEERKLHLNQFDQWLKKEGKGHHEILGMMKDWHREDPRGFDKYLSAPSTPAWTRTAYEHHTGESTGEHVADPKEFERSINYHSLLMAADVLAKAEEETEDDQDQMHYVWREGEPGAYKYMYQDNFGEHVRGTNAPEGHPHHDPEAGPPEIHPHEPTRETAPHIFDEFGRKLHRPAPEGVETEPNTAYDPEVNHWAHKYEDPETGNEEFISLHRDRVGNHRLALNEDIRQVDSQLEKVRQFYLRLIQGEDQRQKAVGLVLALVDQARALSDGDDSGLLSMKIKDVSITGNAFKMKYKDASGSPHIVTAVLDSAAASALHELAQGKKPGDKVFEVDGQPIQQREVAAALDEQFGLQLKQFRTYHGTELFSKEFQRIVGEQASLETKDLPRLADKAYARVMRMMGHQKVDPNMAQKTIVDPVTVEALFMSAIHHHDPKTGEEVEKAYKLHGRMIFQGMPVSIENRKGSVRKWKDKESGTEGKTKMHYAYGYIRGTEGMDGDEVDVYIGPNKESDKVFVIHQKKLPDFKEYDEDKCMLGFDTGEEAKRAFLKQYDDPRFFGSMSVLTLDEFKDKLQATKKRPQIIKGQKEFRPHEPTSKTPSEPGYVYHATNDWSAHDIAHAGHLETHSPSHGTNQSTWPDGSTEKRSYWSKQAGLVHSFAPEGGGGPVILRTPHRDHFKTERGTGDIVTTKPVHADHIEIRHENGSWHPIKHAYGVAKSLCSLCSKSWGTCEHSELIEKAFRGSADTGPVTWTVSVSHPERTPDEEAFGAWIHNHPQHEHDQHWSAFKHATKVEDLPEPDHGREYAHGGDQPDRHHPVFDQEESYHHGSDEEEVEQQPQGEEQEPETVKSILDSMLRVAS